VQNYDITIHSVSVLPPKKRLVVVVVAVVVVAIVYGIVVGVNSLVESSILSNHV
jgi:hypothetical protein